MRKSSWLPFAILAILLAILSPAAAFAQAQSAAAPNTTTDSSGLILDPVIKYTAPVTTIEMRVDSSSPNQVNITHVEIIPPAGSTILSFQPIKHANEDGGIGWYMNYTANQSIPLVGQLVSYVGSPNGATVRANWASSTAKGQLQVVISGVSLNGGTSTVTPAVSTGSPLPQVTDRSGLILDPRVTYSAPYTTVEIRVDSSNPNQIMLNHVEVIPPSGSSIFFWQPIKHANEDGGIGWYPNQGVISGVPLIGWLVTYAGPPNGAVVRADWSTSKDSGRLQLSTSGINVPAGTPAITGLSATDRSGLILDPDVFYSAPYTQINVRVDSSNMNEVHLDHVQIIPPAGGTIKSFAPVKAAAQNGGIGWYPNTTVSKNITYFADSLTYNGLPHGATVSIDWSTSTDHGTISLVVP